MAALDGTITMTTAEYRPCYANNKKALFHRWTDKEEILLKYSGYICGNKVEKMVKQYQENGLLPNSADVEKVKTTFAIVEYEDGTIDEVRPQQIRFTDDKIKQYAF